MYNKLYNWYLRKKYHIPKDVDFYVAPLKKENPTKEDYERLASSCEKFSDAVDKVVEYQKRSQEFWKQMEGRKDGQ